MKKIIAALMAIFIVFTNISILAEEDISLGDLLSPDEIQQAEAIEKDKNKETTNNSSEELTDENAPKEDKIQESVDDENTVLITAAGDVTIGGDIRKKNKSLFDIELAKQKGDISFPFRNVKDIFENDDMTLVNFEGTLTTSPINPKRKSHKFLFSAPPEYVEMLPKSSIEAVALENNHVDDHGKKGYEDTEEALKSVGIVYSNAEKLGVYKTKKGIDIAMLSYQTFNGLYPKLFEQVPKDVQAAKAKYPIVIVSFHWGEELDYWPNENQQKLGKATIDAGADLVLGHHSHRINPIEEYKGKLIVYSLGNCSFAGNKKPSDMSTFIFQIKFRVVDGVTSQLGFRIIPSRISSRTDYNDFAITPYTKEINIESVLNTLQKNGKYLENPVQNYPLEW